MLGLSLLTGATHATVITFDNLTGPQVSPLGSYSESGYSVSGANAGWGRDFTFGAPAASAGTHRQGILEVVDNGGGAFLFQGLDFGSTFTGTFNYTVVGFVTGGSLSVFGYSGSLTVDNNFVTVPSLNNTLPINKLRVIMFVGARTQIPRANVDSIEVTTATPEPATLASAGLAIVAGLVARRRRRAA